MFVVRGSERRASVSATRVFEDSSSLELEDEDRQSEHHHFPH